MPEPSAPGAAGEPAPESLALTLPSHAVTLEPTRASDFMAIAGFANPEKTGRWTNGTKATLVFSTPLPAGDGGGVVVILGFRPFVWPKKSIVQTIILSVGEHRIAEWQLTTAGDRHRAIFIPREWLAHADRVPLDFTIPTAVSPVSLDINADARDLGLFVRSVSWFAVDEAPNAGSPLWLLGRQVGPEARKSFDEKLQNGFWSRFITGPRVLDIGFRGTAGEVVPIMPGAIGVDLDYPGYDGRTLPFPDGSQDTVYASHSLEHIPGYLRALQEWHRVVKVGGHIIIVVPHAHLYERRRRPPSRWNTDHQRCYTPASLLAEVEAALPPNSFRVRYLEDNDHAYRYDAPPETHPFGCYEITVVLEKIVPPAWRVDD